MSERLDYRSGEEIVDRDHDKTPMVSVVVPTYNRTDCLLVALDSLLQQDYGTFEMIVIDQSEGTSERKRQYYEAHPQIQVHRLEHPNRCHAKNTGVRLAKGEVVLICDDDIIAPPDLVAKHVCHYAEKQVGGGSCRIVEDGQPRTETRNVLKVTFFGRLVGNAHSSVSLHSVASLNGGNMSFRRELLAGGDMRFEERFIGTGILEEPDLAWRIRKRGYRLFFDASTTVHHAPQQTGNLMILKQHRADWYHDYFHNLALFWRKHGKYLRLIASVPYVVAASIWQTTKYRLPLTALRRMIGGYWKGIRCNLGTVSQDNQ